MKKVLGVLLLLAGVVLCGLGAYGYFGSGDQERCLRFREQAVREFEQASAAEGTPKGAELLESAQGTSAVADIACANAAQTRQNAMLMGIGGVISLVLGVVLLAASRRHAV